MKRPTWWNRWRADDGMVTASVAVLMAGLSALLLADTRALWLPPPNLAPPPDGSSAPIGIDNPHLQAIARGILERPDSALALQGLLLLLGEAREGHFHARAEFVPVLDGEELLPVLQGQLFLAQARQLPEKLDEMLGRSHASLTPRSR